MSDLSYVRTEMLSEKEPPATQKGIVKWMRENLFSSWLNAIMTLLAVYCIYLVLKGIIPWAFQSSWTASSLTECRDFIKETYGEGVHGACWAVIRERYHQLLFGFYPPEHYWRILVAFVLMIFALGPVLFSAVPKKLLAFTAVYPFVAYWLLWGGTIWGPLGALLGFVLAYFVVISLAKYLGPALSVGIAVVLSTIWWIYGVPEFASALDKAAPIGIAPVDSDQFGGFALSLIIGVTGIACSLPLGILLALGRQSKLIFIKVLCVGFIEFIRGVPLITLLFVASTLLNYFLPPGTSFSLILRVIIMVTLFASAYMAEVIRGGLAALPKGQYEAADALGLDYWKATRLIIMPQALKITIPSIVSTFIGLFKDTVLVSIISMLDPLGFSTAIRANQEWNGIVWELYGFIAVIFFIFCFAMSRYSIYLERKLKTGH